MSAPVVNVAVLDEGTALCKNAREQTRVKQALAFQSGQLSTELVMTFMEGEYPFKDGSIKTRFRAGLEKDVSVGGEPGKVKLTSFDSMANTEQLLAMQ